MLEKYNAMLKEHYGRSITVELISRIDEDDGSEWFYYTSARYGESDGFETLKEAYDAACLYLSYVGELW